VLLPNLSTEVRISRGEFEALVRPRVAETVRALERAIESAGLAPGELAKVLLVGGSSRIPLCAQLVQEATGVPVAIDAQPKFAVCLGAAASGLRVAASDPPPSPVFAAPEPEPPAPAEPPPVIAPARPSWTTLEDTAAPTPTPAPEPTRFFVPPPEPVPAPAPPPPPAAPVAARVPSAPPGSGPSRRVLLVAGGLLVLAAAAVGAFAVLGGGDDKLVQRFATANLGNGQCQAAFEFADGWQERVDNVTIISDNAVVASGPPDFEGEFVYPANVDLDAILLENDRGDVVETATPDPDDC
jgi:hypothetical protein